MKFHNPQNIPVVNSFLRMYGEVLEDKLYADHREVTFLYLPDSENDFKDPIARLRNKIYLSKKEIGKMGFSIPEQFAAIAHEIGHIAYGTLPFGSDAETRADGFAAEIGLAEQMIGVIERIILSRRYREITSSLVQRIYFLQHLVRQEQPESTKEFSYML